MDAVLRPFLQSRVNTLLDSFRGELGPRLCQTQNNIENLVRLQAHATTNADVCDDRTAKTVCDDRSTEEVHEGWTLLQWKKSRDGQSDAEIQ